jgi:hypothetical protein
VCGPSGQRPWIRSARANQIHAPIGTIRPAAAAADWANRKRQLRLANKGASTIKARTIPVERVSAPHPAIRPATPQRQEAPECRALAVNAREVTHSARKGTSEVA